MKYLAKCRDYMCKINGVKDVKRSDDESLEIETLGLAGEFAFCKMFNMYPDFTIEPRSGGADCKDDYDFGYDVKTTDRENGMLISTLKENPDVDFYALMTGTIPTFTYRGEVPALTLRDEKNIVDLGHGKSYALSQERLKELSTVK